MSCMQSGNCLVGFLLAYEAYRCIFEIITVIITCSASPAPNRIRHRYNKMKKEAGKSRYDAKLVLSLNGTPGVTILGSLGGMREPSSSSIIPTVDFLCFFLSAKSTWCIIRSLFICTCRYKNMDFWSISRYTED